MRQETRTGWNSWWVGVILGRLMSLFGHLALKAHLPAGLGIYFAWAATFIALPTGVLCLISSASAIRALRHGGSWRAPPGKTPRIKLSTGLQHCRLLYNHTSGATHTLMNLGLLYSYACTQRDGRDKLPTFICKRHEHYNCGGGF